MGWTKENSLKRIRRLQDNVPEGQVEVKSWGAREIAQRRLRVKALRESGRDEPVIFAVRPSEAVVVDGVHIYVQLIDYHNAMVSGGQETESSHAKSLGMLHLHYAGCDRVIEEFEAQRVDFHGGRLHAVVVSPGGPEGAPERAARALAFGHTLKATIEAAGERISQGRYRSRVRIGMDCGPAVAVNSGRGDEPEPLFLGSPANYAAKLAEGDVPGIYISDSLRRDLGLFRVNAGLLVERANDMSAESARRFVDERLRRADIGGRLPEVDHIVENLIKSPELAYFASPAAFEFHRHEPPLRTIDFKTLMPSNSIRMPMASIFADLNGFTKYVDGCIQDGRVAEMVANLHVIRGELAGTLKEDSDGRKVRFIGDCIHGLIAVGSRTVTDEPGTVLAAVQAAGGMRSSFELCRSILPRVDELDLAIGIELGPTPVTRLGLRGDRSVRCASSRAVSWSENCQQGCKVGETAIGPAAYDRAPVSVKRLFDENGVALGLDDASVAGLLAAPAVITSGSVSHAAKPYAR